MKQRLAVVAGATAIIASAAYLLLRPAPGTAQPAARRAGKVEVHEVAAPREAPAAAARPRMVMTESGWRPATARKQPREWVDPVSGAINREIVDAVPDPEAAAQEELRYRKSRLRLTLSDNAAPCWSGGDSREEVELEYTLVVEHEVIRADNVRVKTSSITNPTVERCIVESVRGLRAPGDKLPDMREDQGLIMSLHDLQDRNDREIQNSAKRDDPPSPIDRPTARPSE